MTSAPKPNSPSCERNKGPILEVLQQHFQDIKQTLEIGSGTGQHAVHFGAGMPWLTWQTSDMAESLPGIRLWLEEAALPNVLPPIELDVRGAWPKGPYDAVFSANTLHIMGWPEVQKLFARLDGVMARDAVVAVYGPFNYGGRYTSDSNEAFDGWLKQQYSPASGIRDFEAVNALAESIGLALIEDRAMPANNRTLVWARGAGGA
jgi:cyclopropane fatty-acyl-phospholipid synthase-like methyltransferase